jgi:uncharacterized protein (DUF58 family)
LSAFRVASRRWAAPIFALRRAVAEQPALGFLLLWGFVTLIALAGGWSLIFYLSWALALLLAAAYLLAASGLHGLYFNRRTRALRAEVGSYFDEHVVVENLSWIPKLWLEIEDRGQHPERDVSCVVSLGPYGRFVRPVHTLCRQRGVFQLGPVFAESRDPFGIFRFRRQISGSSSLVVYPVALDLPSFGRLPGDLPGGSLQGERVQFTTPNVAGVREYRPGDTMNRIHWPTTARQGRLMVKEFELDPFSDVWLILDLESGAMVGAGPESTEEYAVTACASLAKRFLDEGRAVGIVSQALVLTADRETRQLLKALELLAFVGPRPRPSLEGLLLGEQQRFGRTDCLVIVTATTDDRWARVTRTFAARGVRSSAVVLDAETFGAASSSLPLLGALAAAGVPTYPVRRGDALPHALSAPSSALRAAWR